MSDDKRFVNHGGQVCEVKDVGGVDTIYFGDRCTMCGINYKNWKQLRHLDKDENLLNSKNEPHEQSSGLCKKCEERIRNLIPNATQKKGGEK